MNVLWVFAHPEQSSLNGSLLTEGLRILEDLGHDCRVSDLYGKKWKAVVDRDDYTQECAGRLHVARASEKAYTGRTRSADIVAEQEKLKWADAMVFEFPLWWYGMPAILKGWFDRVFVKGFAYGIADPTTPGRTLRYGDGPLAGKRALTTSPVVARRQRWARGASMVSSTRSCFHCSMEPSGIPAFPSSTDVCLRG